MSTILVDNDKSTTFISEEKSTDAHFIDNIEKGKKILDPCACAYNCYF
jgi:hypothetical protein